MEEETLDELTAAYGDGAIGVPLLQAPCGKGNLCLRNGKDTAVGDGDYMRIPAKVFDGIAEAVECLLDIRASVPAVKAVAESLPSGRIPKGRTGVGEGKGIICIKPVQKHFSKNR